MVGKRSTPADLDLIRVYLDEVGRYDVLSLPEERALGETIQDGLAAEAELTAHPRYRAPKKAALRQRIQAGQQAQQALILHNLRLVVSVAKRFAREGYPLSDAIQDGTLGLFQAARKYSPYRPTKFATVAPWWIRQAIQRGQADQLASVRIPSHAWDRLRQIHATFAYLTDRLGREPTDEEVAEELNDSVRAITTLLQRERTARSLDAPLTADTQTSLAEIVADPGARPVDEAGWSDQAMLVLARRWFSKRDIELLYRCIILEEPYDQVAKSLRVARTEVDAHLRILLTKMRHPSMSYLYESS